MPKLQRGILLDWLQGIGKTEAQLKQMSNDRSVCKYCKAPGLITELDHETEDGKFKDEETAFIVDSVISFFSGKISEDI